MAGTIDWNDPRAWAIPNTDEQNSQLRKYGGSSNMPGAAYGSGGPAVVTRQYAEQVRAQTGSYPPNSRIIEVNGTETNRPAVAPSTSRTWGEFFTGSPSSAASKEQQLWARATGQNPNPTIQTLPQQLSERRALTESVVRDPRGAMSQSQIPSYRQPESPAAGSSQSRPSSESIGGYSPRSEYSTGNGMPMYGRNFQSDIPAYGRDFQSNMPMLGEGGAKGDRGGYGYLSQQQPATKLVTISDGIKMVVPDTGRSRGVEELRKELREPGYQSRYDFKGVMAEKDAQQMVQEADQDAQEAKQGPATNNQSQTTPVPSAGSMHGQQSPWISARPIGGGHVAAQHVSGRWFLDYDLGSPWGM